MGSDNPSGRFPGFRISFFAGLALLLMAFHLSISSGTIRIGAAEIMSIVREVFTGRPASQGYVANVTDTTGNTTDLRSDGAREVKRQVFVSIRLPRALSTILAGMILGMSGVVFQCLLRNDLADPYVLGVSAGGAVGAVAAMLLGVSSGLWTASAAFAGAGLTMAVVYGLASGGGLSSQILIVAGIMVNATLSSFISLLVYLSPRVKPVMFWLMGSFSGSGIEGTAIMAVCALVLLAAGSGLGRWMDALAFGDATAASLGIRVKPVRTTLFLVASCASGAVVAFHGVIGFAGLMVPHLARSLAGPCHRALFPLCAIYGGLFLCLSDTLARTVMAPEELPIGVITGLLGGPFFIRVLRRRREA